MSDEAVLLRPELLDRVREVENVFIPLADGTRLAARLFLPKGGTPAAAILEYLPYRKRDFMRARDDRMHRWFAAHGYAVARVDIRGTGDSDGVLADEYCAQELSDGLEVIAWMAAQAWCDGSVGVMGISWGGFNALQLAALRPPALRAVITLCASDDRYADDAHYMGGCLLNENMQWGSILTLYASMPPDPAIVGDRWRSLWLERLEAAKPFPAEWMRHPTRDDFWKHGSVSEDLSAIRVPVYAIGGWADGYSNSVFRLLAGLEGPRKGLVGPWAHTFPHHGYPGPKIGFLQEAKRWWDHWLRGTETSIMEEPMLRVWMQDPVAPAPHYARRPGRWVAETAWPSPRVRELVLAMNRRRLEPTPAPGPPLTVRSPQSTGGVAGEWCAFGAPGEMPLDQRADDGRSLVFDTTPLEEPLEILGAPVVELELASSERVGMVAVRLCDVAPDGASTRVSYGLLNLNHRHGPAEAKPWEPNRRERVRVQLNDIAHRFEPGRRIRVAVSTSYWPIAWPAPAPTSVQIWPGESLVRLPVRPPREEDATLPQFEPPEEAPGIEHRPLRALPFRRRVERNLVTDEIAYTLTSDGGEFGDHAEALLADLDDLTLGYSLAKEHRIRVADPLSACTEMRVWTRLARGGWDTWVKCETRLEGDAEAFVFRGTLEARESGETIFRREWDQRIPRELPGPEE